MSRALDNQTKEALKRGDHLGVFEDISSVLSRQCDQLYEIELLGQSTILTSKLNYLQDENALAIPKLRLVQAFIVARQILLSHIQGVFDDTEDRLQRATAVILLMDPEFLTAANIRKRSLQKRIHEEAAVSELQKEKYFVDSLLTSRLHRHTKSPTLWNHRRWLMDQFRIQNYDIKVEDDIQNIIAIAGERHPRNYYAWCHARYLVHAVIIPSQNREAALSRIITVVKNWSFSHHDDISGWQFLLFLLDTQPSETSPTVREAIQLVESFKWRNESVWYFLRYVVASPHLEEHYRNEISRVRTILLETAAEDGHERRILEAVPKWLLL